MKNLIKITLIFFIVSSLSYISYCNINDLGDPLWLPPHDKLVFISVHEESQGELYILEKYSESPVRLTNNDLYDNNCALSPDKKKVVFHRGNSDDFTSFEIYMIDLETKEETRLTNNNYADGHPDWSPDGKKIIYASFNDGNGNPSGTADIYVLDLDSMEKTRLTTSVYEDNDPEWSPDGSKIIFKSTRNTQEEAREEIYVMDSDGTNIQRLTTTTGWESDHDPSWSPDSDAVVFVRYSGIRPWTDIAIPGIWDNWQEITPWNNYKVDLEGNITQLTNTEYIAGLVVYSKDKEHVLYYNHDFEINENDELLYDERNLLLVNLYDMTREPLIKHNETLQPYIQGIEYFDW
jgi:Tol biopolymer transport system component